MSVSARAGLAVSDTIDYVVTLDHHAGGVLVERGETFEVGYTEFLADAGRFAGDQRGHGSDEGVGAGLVECVLAGSLNGFAIGFAVEKKLAADGLIGELV